MSDSNNDPGCLLWHNNGFEPSVKENKKKNCANIFILKMHNVVDKRFRAKL